MPFNASKKSPIRYFLVVFLILVLFVFAFFQYLRNTNIKNLRANVAELISLKDDYSKIDSCIYILYKAENNSRLFAVTADRAYVRQFYAQIQKISGFLDELKNRADRKAAVNFKGLLRQKKQQTESYLKLRQLTDSLEMGFLKLGLLKAEEPKISMPSFKAPARTVVKVDTIKQEAAPKKRLFGRIADAFSSKKKNEGSVVITKTEVRNEGAEDFADQIKTYNEHQLKGIREYYRNLYSNSNKLKDDEKAILLLNNKLIAQIILLLNEYKSNEIAFIAENKAMLSNELQSDLKSLDGISIVNSILLLSLIVILLYNIAKMFKHEKVLVSMNKRAAQETHSKSRFLANMSHEIRTPLNSIVGFSEQLAKGKLEEEQVTQVKAIRSSSEMLLEVVNEILDFSKFEVGKINFEHISFVPAEEIMEVFNSMNVLASNKNITLVNKIAFHNDVVIAGDRFRLKQVVMNLLTNAIKFTQEGQVVLKAQFLTDHKKQGILKVQVEDTGIGMSKQDLDLIFEEFSQVYSPAAVKQQGTGLGLAICKKIVELQGGKISVSSVAGKGSVFSFEIPYEIAEKTKEVSPEQKEQGISGLEGKRILLVDDNKMNVLLAQTILKKWKLEYDSAYDGKQALELFRKNQYDLVLTDIEMPVMGGVELTHEIRYNGDASKSGVPILGVTAHVLKENRDIYLKAGMNDLVLKPFLEQQLIDQIRKYI